MAIVMGGRGHFLLFLVSVFIFGSVAAGHRELVDKKPFATVHVLNAMPNGSERLRIHCNSRFTDHGKQEVGVGEDYQFGVEEKALYYCDALWERFIAAWHAFQPRRDGNHTAVFWMVKRQGFFFSPDNSTWIKKSAWQTE